MYTHFKDKEQLFAELIRGNIDRVDAFVAAASVPMGETHGLDHDLCELARRHIRAVVQPEAVQLRRLVIGEAGRFPELARSYYERVPQRVIGVLAAQLQHLVERGLLRLEDAALAANHLAWLILGFPLDEAMFCGETSTRTPAELDRLADAAVEVLLAAYRRPSSPVAAEFAARGPLDDQEARSTANHH